eukprot:tig00000955_g5810.t1
MGDKGKGEGGGEDPRIKWFEERVMASLKPKPEKWKGTVTSAEGGRAFSEFMDNSETRRFLIYDDGGKDALKATCGAPTSIKRKGLYFLKKRAATLTIDNLKEEVIVGDLTTNVLQQLSLISQEVLLPLLSNTKNQQGWPDVISKEVMDNFHRFVGSVYVTIGQTQGKTLLPLPPADMINIEKAVNDKEKIHRLESSVVSWTHLIKTVLRSDPESMFRGGKNPGPTAEVEFWVNKAANLNSIHEQLSGDKIQKVMKILELTKSTYFPAFGRLIKEVAQAKVEANDNAKFLRALEKTFGKLTAIGQLNEMTDVFKPMMHQIMLVWKHSQYYNTSGRLVVLMREICNDIIEQARSFVNGHEIFKIEPQDAVDRLKMTIKVLTAFKQTYLEYKQRVAQECPSNPWRVQNSALFSRLDSFMERCHDILDVAQTVVHFNKLERIEIGGTKGRTLSASVRQIYSDFQQAFAQFQNVTYDVLDVEIKSFDDDNYKFRLIIKELERRLGSILTQGFDDCNTVAGAFKLIDSFEGLLEREIIQADLEKKHADLIKTYGEDLKKVQEQFHTYKADPPLYFNMPPVAGALYWCRGLIQRIEEPMEKFKGMGKMVLESEEGKEVVKTYTTIESALKEYQYTRYHEWEKGVEDVSQEKLKQSLLRRSKQNQKLLHVNFNPALVRLLREVKYFTLLGLEIPDSAMQIYKKAETFRTQIGNLELIVNTHNQIHTTILEVEKPLLQKQLSEIDKLLEKGLKHLNWKSHGIGDFISEAMTKVKAAHSTLTTLKTDVAAIQKILDAWSSNPLFQRKESKTYTPEEILAAHMDLMDRRFGVITEGGNEIHKLLGNSNKVLKVSKGAQAWKVYVDYVNDVVVQGIAATLIASLKYLGNQCDPAWIVKTEASPLLEVKLELEGKEVIYQPELGLTAKKDGVRDLLSRWISDFFNIATLVKRLDTGDGDYMQETKENEEVLVLVNSIGQLVADNEDKCNKFREQFLAYSYLWTQDLNQTFQEFLDSTAAENRQPNLDEFEKKIAQYKPIGEAIHGLPSVMNIGWLRIDAKPIKQALSTWISKWAFLYINFLSQRVINSVKDLYAFMARVEAGIDAEVGGSGSQVLMDVMGLIRDTVQLLRKYDTHLPDQTLSQLDEAPINWTNTKKRTMAAKERIATIQNNEAEKIKTKVSQFADRVSSFRSDFKRQAFFRWSEDVDESYNLLDRYNAELSAMEQESKNLNDLQELFELTVSSYKDIKDMRAEIIVLKQVWDMGSLVVSTFNDWKKTLWDKIDVDFLTEETRKIMKEVKMLNKLSKDWECYKGLEDCVKNLLTSLPLVQDLHSPAMRDRHWKQLMRATGVLIQMDANFSLADLLALKLHEYVDAVAEIVDRANKELIIEKNLTKIEATWANLSLVYEEFEGSETLTIKAPDDVVEAKEDNLVQLQNMMAGKYVANNPDFQEQVGKWQRKLGAVDTVLTTWLDVQKKWISLESIFIGSADIRTQLPEDSKRFDAIDAEWKELMKEAHNQTNAVEACNVDGRGARLEAMLAGLEKCEKALADYLETKRIAFPRFYFVAPADLVDILSKGSNPQLIQKHLSKCFDNIQKLKFEEVDGKPTKNAIGMYSKEMEYVAFPTPFKCEGAVETWLSGLVEAMQNALKHVLNEAAKEYDEHPRQKWLFRFCAQMVIVVSRIIYTEDVARCFEQLEEGNEMAMKDYNKKQIDQLASLSELIISDLTSNDRRKVITLVTVDVHARDVVSKLITDKCDKVDCFQWVSQLRYTVDENTKICRINICDFEINYQYEYIGNCGCLVITPLTDRCYVTLTQAQRLVLGGAPAGPAGTGKTETTKDLARAIGIMCYVFNCSDQMDYKSMGQIYKGLAQTGAWGCFDEFNRIPIEVLSVCSTQYKSILDAIRSKKKRFVFEDEEISLNPTAVAFITMNPGYAGRTELPESLKALFRPVAMIVPDMDLITEIMLYSEGFQNGKILARKFMILYRLCQDLLSKQDHYDWKLRAIKTTLNVAGGLKRSDPELSEDRVLLRALRDFNIGKIVTDDIQIFMGLLEDLFPKTLELVPRKRDQQVEDIVKESAKEMGLQPEDKFVLKIVQLRELFVVRWSVFLLGPAGCGKTQVWKTLQRAQAKLGEKTVASCLNPKSVTRNELYGYISQATREWKDGLISQIFRDMANTTNIPHQWIILDGDIDAEWIESMNTVMDDNKMLTLASNERIPLTNSMRLLFEVGDMRNASPATVSRGGVIFINDSDIGWHPFAETWISNQQGQKLQTILQELFHRYVQHSLDFCRKNFKYVTPLVEISQVSSLCYILEGLFAQHDAANKPPLGQVPPGTDANNQAAQANAQLLVEHYFVFSAVWAFGGALLTDKQNDFRAEFSKWWKEEWKVVKYPDGGTVFDYLVDPDALAMVGWVDKVQSYTPISGTLFANIFVPTLDTTRLTYLLDLLIPRRHPVLFVGNAGTGKTTIMKDKLRSLDTDVLMSIAVNLNCFSDSMSLQLIMEQPLEKKTGRQFGPPGSKKLIYFVDDLNMPFVDKYGTQQPIALLRQHMDYQSWYDRAKLQLKEIHNCQYLSCLNPTAGSFTVDPRLQRQYATFAVQMPTSADLLTIYESILKGHLARFDPTVAGMGRNIVKATIDLHKQVAETFLPTAIKFHYIFNLRELSNIMQGLCLSTSEYYSSPLMMARLWSHECERVFRDRLVSENDTQRFDEMIADVSKKYFEEVDQAAMSARPLIFAGFTTPSSDDSIIYVAVPDYAKLRKVLEEKLNEYNEANAVMNLVLFEQAMEHICRITRIIQSPRGNALLVGVGGSGKQSLGRLASFICGYETFQISVTQTYGVTEFKADLTQLYIKTGVKGFGMCFLMTDGQIVDERFMVYINDLLSSGYIPDLFPPEERDNIANQVRSEVKQAGLVDTRDNCWDFFIEKVRKNLHVVLCVSPVGDKFRVRARQFPAMISSTAIDWFQEWSQEALVSVANRFLREIEAIEPELRESIAHHMAFAHNSVTQACQLYLEAERRYNYTTPKSFLELIALYKTLLHKKREEIQVLKSRLENGLNKLKDTEAIVADLQVALKADQIVVEEKKASANALLEQVGQETAIAEEEKKSAQVEEDACAVIQADVAQKAADCAEDLAKAEPIIQQAEAALNSLDKKSLTELKAFASPPIEVVSVLGAVMILTAPGGKVPKDISWNAGKKFMGNVDAFMKQLLTFDKENIPDNCVTACEQKIVSDKLDVDVIKTKSAAAAGMCSWCVNICKYFRIYQDVAPKRARLEESNQKLAAANSKLSVVRARVAELEARLAALTAKFDQATDEKLKAIAQAEKTQTRANLADRLVNGLADEKVRWTESIERFSVLERTLIGDVLLSSAFVSYIGAFNMRFRTMLVTEKWLPDLIERQIPLTEGIEPLTKLTDEAEIARWNNEGLPADRLSVENGAIVCSSGRWPLIIDPQLQGIKWIMNREQKNGLKIIQLSQARYVDAIENAIQNGMPVLIENLGENIDAVLEPVLSRSTIKKGRQVYIKLGDKEVEYDPNFRLYLQTKLPNPHYKPEIAAQCTLINFTVTEEGLEDQLLAMVVNKERPDLEATRADLLKQQNEFKITLKELEDNLLFRLSNAQGDILSDIDLIENLEKTKRTAKEIAEKVEIAKETAKSISAAREAYRPVAIRGSLIYFLIDSLNVLDHMYQFSMANFVTILKKGMDLSADDPELAKRVENLIETSCYTVFAYVAAGLFERHKLIFGSQLAIRILQKRGEIDQAMLDFLLRGPRTMGEDNPCAEWLSDSSWNALLTLKEFEVFEALPADVEGSAKRWREWCELERPEKEPFPGDWKKLANEPFLKLLLIRALRTDRMTDAMASFVGSTLGSRYMNTQPPGLEVSYQDARPDTAVFFILSPGVDPVKEVELLGKKFGMTYESGKLANVSLGQGQEPIAERALEKAHRSGGWVVLQNVHLTPRWTGGYLEKRMDKIADGAHEDFRLFLSAEPSDVIPINILQSCIKLTNEPPEGLRPNMTRAMRAFAEEMFENSTKQSELRTIVFALCFFHSVLLERKKFGPQGWNMKYPFNIGDLTASAMVCNNYLESNAKVPWEDLKYIFGEIMYGGHIVDDWDRRLCNAYLNAYMKEELLDGLELFPGFPVPKPMNLKAYAKYVDTTFTAESPICFGLHPNAEIGFRLEQAETLFRNIVELQPKTAGAGAGGLSLQDKAKQSLDDIMEKLPDMFPMEEIVERVEERTPYINVFLQEIERMNFLLKEMKRSLAELDLGLRGDLTISEPMERLMHSLYNERVPDTWENKAYPSLRPLSSWVHNLLERIKQLTDFAADLQLPKVTWLSGLFNPQSFLTAVMQTTARKNDWPLDKTVIQTEVTKKTFEDIEQAAREGAFIHGLVLEGARWDDKSGALDEQRPKELFAPMPVINIKAVTVDKVEDRGNYACPVYKTQKRGNTYVFTAGLKTRLQANKWVLGGAALIMDVVK